MRIIFVVFISFIISLGTLTACSQPETAIPGLDETASPSAAAAVPTETPPPTIVPSATPLPPRVLTVCLGEEPSSLFLYGDTTSAAQSIRQAIYDGPFDVYNYEMQPVILEKLPSIADGDAFLRPVEVVPGTLIVDHAGAWVSLAEGVVYRPSGCASPDCALSYTGTDPVMLDELVARFRLLPDLQWADGMPLTAADSVYAYQVYKELYARAPSELARYTHTYQAVDDLTVEWVGIPGYQSVYETHFFTPFPRHLWASLAPADLFASEISARTPLGWGPYKIDEWVAGDHIRLSRNSNYFRAAEGLPKFDFLVFRFMETAQAALDALLVGECDFVDRSAMLDTQLAEVFDFAARGSLQAVTQSGMAWEQLSFGIEPFDPARPRFFANPAVRQAVAMCIDRAALTSASFLDEMLIPDTYVPVTHPVRNPEITPVAFDLTEAARLLQIAGWVDHDADPSTARISAGVPGVLDGTPFEVLYLAPADAERPEIARQIAAALAQCGVQAEVDLWEWDQLLGSGPEGPVFGRQYDLAQFAWAYSIQPTCGLFTGAEIPGPYPEYPSGWGGGNATGYQQAAYDQFCALAQNSLPASDLFLDAQYQAQAIFMTDTPALPLYQRLKVVAMRPDMCAPLIDPAFGSALSAIEVMDYGESCE